MDLITTQNISIDFNQKGYKTINAKQCDKETRYVVVRCTDHGIFVPLDSTVYANARTMTADGRALLDPATIQDDGTILLELDDTLLAAPGRAATQIDIYQNGTEKRLTTMSFFINVEPSVYGDDTITASDEFNALTDLIKKATKDYEYVINESKKHADNAKASEDNAANSAANAASSATDASGSAAEAATSAMDAQQSTTAAAQEATASGNSAKAAKVSEDNAKAAETNASNSENNAANSAETATNKASESSTHADMSKSYAVGTNNEVREGDATDNAKKYYEQAKDIAESFAGTLRPKGTITFENLPSATNAKEGDMYNISNQFTTTASFKEGAGNVIPAGSNVYRTDDGFWDVLAGSPVSGIKGDAEASYRRGNVNITAGDLGLGNVDNTADSAKPVSAAQQEALDGKVSKAGDKMTGDLEVDGTVTATKFAGNATSATKIATKRNINGIEFDGTANAINYAVCSTEADMPEKTVECSGFSLITGAEITVKFMVTNKAANPTLNVNGTGAKPIYYRGVPIAAGTLAKNRTYSFKYNGEQYEEIGDIARTNSAQYSGYVTKGEGNPNKVWGTDADGNPGWQEGAESSDIVKLTKEEYDTLPDTKLTDGKIYFISGESGGTSTIITAGNVIYDNSESGLSATDVQNAIDELLMKIGNLDDNKIDSDNGSASGWLTLQNPDANLSGNVRWISNQFNIFAGSGLDDEGRWHLWDDENSMDIIYYQPNTRKGAVRGGNSVEIRTDGEGGNVSLTGPNAKQHWEMDNWNDNQCRIYCHDNETNENYFPFTLNKDYIIGITYGNVPFYRLTKDNMDAPPAPNWNGGFSIGMGIMEDSSMPIISFSVMGYHLQFSFSEVNVVKRMKHQSNPWSKWTNV